jgi:hypothetical protein
MLNELINLNNQTLYIKQCHCNAIIHNHCLGTWHARTQKCPICRVVMVAQVGALTKTTLFIIKCIKTVLIILYALTMFQILYGFMLYLN